jgi:hypothetical protein
MNARAFLDELSKIADAGPPAPSKPTPINAVAPKGPSVPHPGGLKPPPLPAKATGMGSALMEGLAGAKGKNPFASMKLAHLLKLAALNARTMLPGSSAGAMKQVQTTVRDIPRVAPLKNVPNEAAVAARFNPPTRPPPPAPAQSGTFSVAPRSQITPSVGPLSNTIPAPAAAANAPTQLPPAPQRSSMRPAPPTGAPNPNLAVTMPPPARMPKVAEDLGHGQPGHDHKSSVEKLRAAVQAKHPHILKDKIAYAGVEDAITHGGALLSGAKNLARRGAEHLVKNEDAHEIAGLATLAVPSIDNIQARLRGGDEHNSKQILPEYAHDAMEVGGLGYLAAPMIAKGRLGPEAVKALGHG